MIQAVSLAVKTLACFFPVCSESFCEASSLLVKKEYPHTLARFSTLCGKKITEEKQTG